MRWGCMVGYYREGVVGLKSKLGMGRCCVVVKVRRGKKKVQYPQSTVPALQTSAQGASPTKFLNYFSRANVRQEGRYHAYSARSTNGNAIILPYYGTRYHHTFLAADIIIRISFNFFRIPLLPTQVRYSTCACSSTKLSTWGDVFRVRQGLFFRLT